MYRTHTIQFFFVTDPLLFFSKMDTKQSFRGFPGVQMEKSSTLPRLGKTKDNFERLTPKRFDKEKNCYKPSKVRL